MRDPPVAIRSKKLATIVTVSSAFCRAGIYEMLANISWSRRAIYNIYPRFPSAEHALLCQISFVFIDDLCESSLGTKFRQGVNKVLECERIHSYFPGILFSETLEYFFLPSRFKRTKSDKNFLPRPVIGKLCQVPC